MTRYLIINIYSSVCELVDGYVVLATASATKIAGMLLLDTLLDAFLSPFFCESSASACLTRSQ